MTVVCKAFRMQRTRRCSPQPWTSAGCSTLPADMASATLSAWRQLCG